MVILGGSLDTTDVFADETLQRTINYVNVSPTDYRALHCSRIEVFTSDHLEILHMNADQTLGHVWSEQTRW